MMSRTLAAALVLVASLSATGLASQFDPHVYPQRGPFFEGWYLRVSLLDTDDSFGMLFGRVLPHESDDLRGPRVVGSILYRTCDAAVDGDHGARSHRPPRILQSCRLQGHDSYFTTGTALVNGSVVHSNPDWTSPPSFQYVAVDDGNGEGLANQDELVFDQQGNTTNVHFRSGSVHLEMQIAAPFVPWGPKGEGPEGWIDRVPFMPLHWFVYSLASPVTSFTLTVRDRHDPNKRRVTTSRRAVAHMEKNWGASFPSAWLWTEGIQRHGFQSDKVVSYAMSGGPVGVGPVNITAWLIGYRNLGKGIVVNIRPDTGIVTVHHDGCAGRAEITAVTALHKIEAVITAPISSFSPCLEGPEKNGFQRVCSESYDATADIRVYERSAGGSLDLLDEQMIPGAALEFGGAFLCEPCAA